MHLGSLTLFFLLPFGDYSISLLYLVVTAFSFFFKKFFFLDVYEKRESLPISSLYMYLNVCLDSVS